MRSKKTTNILLVLAFLFILTIIILCLLPTEKKPGQKPQYKEFEQDEPERTTKRLPKVTTSSTFSTTDTTETMLSTMATITEKYLPPTEKEETTSSTASTVTEEYVPPTTEKEHHTSTSVPPPDGTITSTHTSTVRLTTIPKYIASSTSEQSTHNETYVLFESSTPEDRDPNINTTTNYPSATSFITDTTTRPIPVITTQTTTITTMPTTTTTAISSTTPYDHIFTLYAEPEGICTSDGCKEISGKMLDSIDHEIDPCENFHEYSCGGVHKDQFLRPENAEENLDQILKEQLVSHDTDALTFYKSCLNYLDGTEEDLKHEGIFPPDSRLRFPKSEMTDWPSQQLTRTISSFINRDLPILFDVTADVRKVEGSIKVLPKLRLSLLDDLESNYDHKYCIDHFHRRMTERSNSKGSIPEEHKPLIISAQYQKGLRPEGDKDKGLNETSAKFERLRMNATSGEETLQVDINAEYKIYLECMNTTGLDLRIIRLESTLMGSDLFAEDLKPIEKKSLVTKIRSFWMDLNGILLNPSNTDGAEAPFTITTLGDINGNTILGGLIKWDDLFEDLFGYQVPQDQEIIIENVAKFSRIFSYFKEHWSDKNIENVLLMLAGEKLFRKGEDRDFKKDFCFRLTKKYFPITMQLLFTKAFSDSELQIMISEIHNLGSSLPVEIARISAIYYYVPTHVEFIDKKKLMSNIELLKTQITVTDDFLLNLHLLQIYHRKNMYNITGKELDDPESCRLLPRDIQIRCNFYTDRLIVPLEQLVPPNFIFRKDMPNYLRLSGVANYMSKMMVFKLGTEDLSLKGYKGNDCLIENVPSVFEEKDRNLKIKYMINTNEEIKSGTLLEFQAFNVAWQVIKHLPELNKNLKINETKEIPLIWLGTDSLSPLNAYLIRKAQENCNKDYHFDLLRISHFKQPPNYFWINTLIKIDTLFGSAWHCTVNSSMAESRECLPEATTTDWFNPYALTTQPLEMKK